MITRMMSPGQRHGVTLLELIVVLAIAGLLLSLLIPAVQQVRETARGGQCGHHLRQVGTAAQGHAHQHGAFPNATFPRDLLPYLDQTGLFDRTAKMGVVAVAPTALADDKFFAGVAIEAYQCPDDPMAEVVRGIAPNYLLNGGTGFRRRDGVMGARLQAITDGLSNTVAINERLIGKNLQPSEDVRQATVRLRVLGYTERLQQPQQIDLFADACQSSPTWLTVVNCPLCYITGLCVPTVNHILTPNANSCYNGVPGGDDVSPSIYSAITATSLHPGGVNALFADGAVRFISENLDRNVWRALGTIAGGESLSPGFR